MPEKEIEAQIKQDFKMKANENEDSEDDFLMVKKRKPADVQPAGYTMRDQ